jgi:hypothetical protein
LALTVAVWFVADFKAIFYQDTIKFDKRQKPETSTAPAINYTACYMPAFILIIRQLGFSIRVVALKLFPK